MFTVNDMMTTHPHTLLRSHSLEDAKALMDEHGIRHIPIVDTEHALIGLVTQRDLLSAQTSCLEKPTLEELSALDIPLNNIMHENIMSVSPHGGLKSAALFMQKHKVGCLPVVEHGKLVGIITDSDFVTIAINLLELQEEVDPMEMDE
ncbi:CBS domain-containing protein [Aliivibrio sifiae]|uniref:Acetoin utilization protein AcuB n=1 Tax=Aliivibrio sifiae TaxID=566293 RepID=A0A2S7XGW9_9GAMM|nr:CBS domain-containing protein [Aliivibrio sifiae]PQJ92738.1 acetoin utilization protein AcuB [Aliivibrio sifiae]GLR74817.1 acetoin utilization protein AcuB [Aliivibrio sifiae]